MSGATSARRANADLKTEARRIIADLKRTVRVGETHWFFALMQAVRDWPLTQETIGGRTYRYLVGGEAFDWLLLAERLCDEIEGLIPDDEREALLFHGRLPEEIDDNDVERLLGAKHRAHLNFLYGIRVEEALQFAVAEEVQKERFASHIWEKNGHVDDEAFQRLYGATRPELLAEFREKADEGTKKKSRPARSATSPADPDEPRSEAEGRLEGAGHNGYDGGHNGIAAEDALSLADLTEFTYWLFRRRVQGSEPARVASDTRKGLAQLQRLEWLRKSGARAVTAA